MGYKLLDGYHVIDYQNDYLTQYWIWNPLSHTLQDPHDPRGVSPLHPQQMKSPVLTEGFPYLTNIVDSPEIESNNLHLGLDCTKRAPIHSFFLKLVVFNYSISLF